LATKPIIITNKNNSLAQSIKELFQYRDLVFLLSYRDIRVRYSQTFLGILWAVLEPVIMVVILFIVFGKIAHLETTDIPYPLYILSGVIGWNYFSAVVSQSGKAFWNSQAMIKKIYFPRLALLSSKALSALVEFGIVFFALIGLLIYYGVAWKINLLFLPLFLLFIILAALAVGVWVSALLVYR